jgi:hypothetical protein
MKVPPVIKILAAAILLYLSLNGILENKICQYVPVQQVIQADQDYLRQSLKSAGAHFAILSGLKASLTMINDSEIFGIAVGRVVNPFKETINFLWRALGLCIVSMTLQMGLLTFFQIIGIRVIFTIGAAIYIIGLGIFDLPRKVGIVCMLTGLLLFVGVPANIYLSKIIFEKSSIAASENLEQSLEDFRCRVNKVKLFSIKNLWPKYARKTAEQIRKSLSAGLNLVISAMIKYFTHVFLIFLVSPLLFFGFLWLIIKRLLDCIGAQPVIVKIDEGVVKGLRKL